MKHLDFTEVDSLEFARCQRPDGTFYGTSGTCRKGVQVGAKEKAALKKAAKAGNKKAKLALDVVEGKISKKDAAKALAAKARKEETKKSAPKKKRVTKSVPPEMKAGALQISSSKPEKIEEDGAKAMRKRFKDSKKELGAGAYGAVKETAEGTVIKQGYIGKNEIAVQQKLADVDGVPKLINHAYTSKPFADRDGDRKGFVEMQKARGDSLMSQQFKLDNPAVKGANATKIQDEYLRLRKELHLRGVAHGDMHEGNITWDGKKMGVIDFGLSKPTYADALREALGTFDMAPGLIGGRPAFDPRGQGVLDGLRRDGGNSAKMKQLQRKVESIQKKAEGRTITEKRAKQLIEELYDGI